LRGDTGVDKYLYNGKELQEDLGLQWYDYGARMYDAAVGRFFAQDRFAEKYLDFSPYQYTLNNPIKYIDINGDSTVIALYGDSNTWYESPTGERFLLYDLHVYTDMTLEQYNEHVENGTLPDANYTAQFARDAHDVTKDGSRVNHSSERYGSNNETPPGTYFLFKRGTNGDYKDGSYDLYIGDDNGSRVINGPDGKRTGIAIHQWDPRDSQGCITSCTGADTSPVTNLMNAIPDLDDDTQPVRMIIQPRNVEVLQWANSSNGTNKYKGVGAQYRSRYRQGPIINGQGGVKPIKPGPLK
jgi:RHS repeat-associated protein